GLADPAAVAAAAGGSRRERARRGAARGAAALPAGPQPRAAGRCGPQRAGPRYATRRMNRARHFMGETWGKIAAVLGYLLWCGYKPAKSLCREGGSNPHGLAASGF